MPYSITDNNTSNAIFHTEDHILCKILLLGCSKISPKETVFPVSSSVIEYLIQKNILIRLKHVITENTTDKAVNKAITITAAIEGLI